RGEEPDAWSRAPHPSKRAPTNGSRHCLRERRVSRIERRREDICSIGAACSPKRADWYSSVSCATGAEISEDGIAAANSRGVCDGAFFQPRFSSRRSISRYSSAASDAVKFPARRARKLQRATTYEIIGRPRKYTSSATSIANRIGKKYGEASARLSIARSSSIPCRCLP